MKVKELIKKLEKVDPEAIIIGKIDDHYAFYQARPPSCKVEKYYINKKGQFSPLISESDYFPEDYKKPFKEFGWGCLIDLD